MGGKNNKNPFMAIINDPRFVEEQLFDAQQSLFNARSVREIKFLTMKINYLKKRYQTLNGNSKKRK